MYIPIYIVMEPMRSCSDYLFNAGPIVSSFSKVSMSTTKKIKGTYQRYRQNVSTREVSMRICSVVFVRCLHIFFVSHSYTHNHQGNARYQQRYTTNEQTKNGKHAKTDTSPKRIAKGTRGTLFASLSSEGEKKKN